MKADVRSKSASVKRNITGTGGGPPMSTSLSTNEMRVEEMIAPASISGINVEVTGIEFVSMKQHLNQFKKSILNVIYSKFL